MNEKRGAPLSERTIALIGSGFITWCAAHRRAGFDDAAVVSALRWDESYRTDEAGQKPQDIRAATLGDQAGVARIYIEAIGGFPGSNEPYAEWESFASARVGVVDSEGRWQSAVATFDSDNSDEDHPTAGNRTIEWNANSHRYDAKSMNLDEGEQESPVASSEVEKGLNEWAGLSRLIEAAGGEACEFNSRRGLGRTINYISRWGFLKDAAIDASAGGDRDGVGEAGAVTFGNEVGCLSVRHLRQMTRHGDDERADLIERLTLNVDMIRRAKRKLPIIGGAWDTLFKLPGFTGRKPFSYLAPGIPMGGVTLMAGVSLGGKSTAAHHFGLIVATPPECRDPAVTWWGVPASEIGHGTVVFLSAEDDDSVIAERHRSLGYPPDEPNDIIALLYDGRTLEEILQEIRGFQNVALVVVDPISSFFEGSVIDDVTAMKVMRPMMDFSRDKQCAVMALAHLQKNADPSSLLEVKRQIIGSQKFFDNARSVLAVARSQGATLVGNVKLNDPGLKSGALTERRLRFDPTNKHLVPWTDDAKASSAPHAADSSADVSRVVQALRAATLRENERRFTRTGDKRGVYAAKLPELVGMTRVAVRDAVDQAVRSGAIRRDGNFLVIAGLDPQPLPPLPPPTLAAAAESAAA